MDEVNSFLERVLAVVVVYERPLPNTPTWKSLTEELKGLRSKMSILVYDNSFAPQPVPFCEFSDSHYQHDAANHGVSVAYNFGYQKAVELKKEWLMLLDQDTHLAHGALMKYYEALQTHPSEILFAPILADQVGIVSPFVYRRGGGVRIKAVVESSIPIRKYKVVNSGILVKASAFNSVGGYEQSLPLDFSDLAFLEKISRITENIVVVKTECLVEFSGSLNMSKEESQDRFVYYAQGAHSFSVMINNRFWLFIRSFARAIKLTIRYRSIDFLMTHAKSWHYQ